MGVVIFTRKPEGLFAYFRRVTEHDAECAIHASLDLTKTFGQIRLGNLQSALHLQFDMEEIELAIGKKLGPLEGIRWTILRRVDPSVTDPSSAIVAMTSAAARQVLGCAPAINMPVGGSDARMFRRMGIPTVVYGPTPFNMGGADENVLVEEPEVIARVHALASFEFLTAAGPASN